MAQPLYRSIEVGDRFTCPTGEWEVIATRYSGDATYRVRRVSDGALDTVWGAELRSPECAFAGPGPQPTGGQE